MCRLDAQSAELFPAWGVHTPWLKTYGLQSLVNSSGLTILLLGQFMVLSGLLFQRGFSKAVLAIVFSVSTICLRAAAPEEVVGTMPEDYLPGLKTILADSLKRSPEMIARSFDHVIQEAKLTMAKSARLPNVGGNFDYGITQTATASNTSSRSRNTGAQYSFNLGQALFHWGAIKNDIEI